MSLPGTIHPEPRRSGPDIVDQIGDTPLVEIKNLLRSDRIRVYAKLEWFNPGGSIKDRPALYMIREGEKSGQLTAEKTIIDATSGNTGIAYAMIAASRGYRIRLFVPGNASPERKKILKAYGVELELTDPLDGSDGAIQRAREVYSEEPEKYFYPDQYSNPANWRSHFETTGREILEQTGKEVTHFVAGLGTSGTFVGTSRRLKRELRNVECISVMPDSPFHGLEGMKHMPSALVPAIYDPSLADSNLEISTEAAQRMVVRLAREEGLFVGISSGAAMAAVLKVADQIESGTIVTIFCDSGDKYLSDSFWEEY